MKRIFIKNLIFKIIILIYSFILTMNICYCNIIFDIDDIGMDKYLLGTLIEDCDLTSDIMSGPGVEIIKNELQTIDDYNILSYIDEHFEDNIKKDKSEVIYSDVSKLTVGKSSNNSSELNKTGRNRILNVAERIKYKQNVEEEDKNIDEENKREGNRVTLYIKSDKNNDNNPVKGEAYKKNYTFYTTCDTLTQLLNEKGISGETDLINTIDGITTIGTTDQWYSSDYSHGYWKGYYWKLYVNGKMSAVGADEIILEDGMRIKWVETYEEMSW